MLKRLLALGCALLAGACATTGPAPTTLAPERVRAVLAAARGKRTDLAERFARASPHGVGAVEAVITSRDGGPWLAFRTAEREIALAPAITPPAKAACVALPEDGGWWFFEASPPAALRLERNATLYRYEVGRECWVSSPLETDGEKALGGARDDWNRAADDATLELGARRLQLGPPGLPLGEVTLETSGGGLLLAYRPDSGAVPTALPPTVIDAANLDGFFGDFISVDRGRLEASSFASARGIRHDVSVAVEIETTAQGAPWFKATLSASFFVPGDGGDTAASASWRYDFGFSGDGVHSHNVIRAATGTRPLPFARLVGEVDVRELDTPSFDVPFEEEPEVESEEEETATEPEGPDPGVFTWYLEAPDGGRIDLWPPAD